MVKQSPRTRSPRVQEHPEDAPTGWPDIQEELAASSGVSLLLVDGHQPPAVVVSNNNSICQAFQSSQEHVKLCDPYCGEAHRKALSAGTTIEYRCHAGLHCFAQPVEIGGKRELVLIGGRTFVKSMDYQTLMERFRNGDLQTLASEELFANIIFAERQRLTDLSDRVEKTARRFRQAAIGDTRHQAVKTTLSQRKAPEGSAGENLEQEVVRLRNELESRSRFSESLQHFLERISSDDPGKTYHSIISNSKDLLKSDRASIQVFDEATNELILKAAIGLTTDPSSVSNMRMGEGVSGEVMETGKALMIADIASSGMTPAPADRSYKTGSFISYPIIIAGRKIGVLNVTDKSEGGSYDDVDLSLLEIIGPQVALALERAEWQERATQFQLMSITHPLTGLPNRRYLDERLSEEVNRSKRYDHDLSFLMIDIDDFQVYNDLNGHQAGDLALGMTGHALRGALRSADVAARYGGEEVCILLPQTSLPETRVIAERICEKIEDTHFPH